MPSVIFIFALSVPASVDNNRVAMMPIAHTNVAADLIPVLTGVIGSELQRTGELEVLSVGDIESLIDFEKQKDLIDCSQTTCLVEIGNALGVDRVLRTHIGRVGKAYVIDMVLIDMREGRSVARSYEETMGRPETLIGVARRSVAKLVSAMRGRPRRHASEPTPVMVDSPTRLDNPAAWITAGAGAATMVVGTVLREESFETAGDITLGVGAAVTLVGLLLLGIDDSPVTPAVGSNTVGLAVQF